MRTSIALLALAGMLAGCGLKGPLYLPQQKPSAVPVPVSPAPGVPLDDMRTQESAAPVAP